MSLAIGPMGRAGRLQKIYTSHCKKQLTCRSKHTNSEIFGINNLPAICCRRSKRTFQEADHEDMSQVCSELC